MTEELKNYIRRNQNWQDKAINQLSFANNFLLSISSGLFVFLFDKEIFSKIQFITTDSKIDKPLTFYSLSLLFVLVSISTGIFVLISRLYDFRLTRHITLTRQRFYENNQYIAKSENKNLAKLPHEELNSYSLKQRLSTILKVLFIKIDFLTKSEMQTTKSDFPIAKFNKIREISNILGEISWKWTKLQGLFLLIGLISYSTYLWLL
jgi:hypothetical protein